MKRDPHSGPVPEQAWHADTIARDQGRVQIFNATRPDGLDGWTMDQQQYELMRAHILGMIDEHAGEDGTIALRDVVDAAQERYTTHPLFPRGRTRNYCTFTKVDLEARCEIDRIPHSSPQRIRRHVRNNTDVITDPATEAATAPEVDTGLSTRSPGGCSAPSRRTWHGAPASTCSSSTPPEPRGPRRG